MSATDNLPKKRGRKAKTTTDTSSSPPAPKKRGRKPKGGKIVENVKIKDNEKEVKTNVILHLKCNSNDIKENSLDNSNIVSYNF